MVACFESLCIFLFFVINDSLINLLKKMFTSNLDCIFFKSVGANLLWQACVTGSQRSLLL